MLESTNQSTKVAVLAACNDQRNNLQTLLEKSGLQVVISEADGSKFLEQLKNNAADVLLIDVGEPDDDAEMDIIDSITEHSDLPILFNDSGPEGVSLAASSEIWAKKLAKKLAALAHGNDAQQQGAAQEQPHPMANQPAVLKLPEQDQMDANPVAAQAGAASVNSGVDANISLGNDSAPESEEHTGAEAAAADLNVWVLGASLGGPQAVRQFLSAISPDLPVAFILAQHIGANHVNLLAEQLDRVTPFHVVPGKTGHRLQHHEVILTPADQQITFTDDGYIALKPSPPAAVYSPSIDMVMTEVAKQFKEKAGTIVFSGMGDDGAEGCEAIAEHGGIVWAQDIASCVVSSMPDQARKTGKVTYSANPEELANHLYEFYASNLSN